MGGQLLTMENSSNVNLFRTASPVSNDERFNPNIKLNELSMKEREAAIEELHGVSNAFKEDPAIIQSSLNNIRRQLSLRGISVFEDAELLKFLRAETFDVEKAAARFNRSADAHRKLFGKQGPIQYSDLSDEDKGYLQSGFMQLLPKRDRAGRAILLCIGSIKQQLKTPVEADLRCLSFLASKAAEDEETQKRGIVMICYALAQKTYDSRNNRPLHLLKALGDFPSRVVATHFCYDNAIMKSLVDFLGEHMESMMLCRFRSHSGEHVECQSKLISFGIPNECLPIDATGQVDLTNHKIFLKKTELKEQRMGAIQNGQVTFHVDEELAAATHTEGEKFLIPGHLDIILGRGQHAKNTPGHQLFTQALEQHQKRYEAAQKSQKTNVAGLILQQLKAGGCRFLKARPGGGWVEVADEVGREKINHAFRNLRSVAKKNEPSKAIAASSQSPIPSLPTSSSLSRKRTLNEAIDSGVYPGDGKVTKNFYSI
ncbi:unnamed protein product [Cylindrotheca closterium]|uniref:DUF6824 domain-containing protein n=1 Tax=Cylindrotheca closterium TaxID=2856 RepID=A0AAD2JGC6_9STRA|nr:unnamed protein product [Cylindrotheca closterium]